MKCTFTIGQKVVCIAEGDWSALKAKVMQFYGQEINVPCRGDILTIRAIYCNREVVGLRFQEITNPIHPKDHCEYGFCYWEFAPLETRKTDISVFQQMLTEIRYPHLLDPVWDGSAQRPRACAVNWAGE